MPNWLQEIDIPPQLAGSLYLALWLLAVQIPDPLAYWLETRRISFAHRLRRWVGWPLVGRMIGLVVTCGYLYLLLFNGLYADLHVGLVEPDWATLVRPWATVVGGTILWLLFLWGAFWYGTQPLLPNPVQQGYGTILGYPAHLILQEAQLALFRGALIPCLGSYWGVWAAVVAKGLVQVSSPAVRRDLQEPGRRALVFLDWGLDWASAGWLLAWGSLWPALLGRALAYGLAVGLYGWLRHRRARAPQPE